MSIGLIGMLRPQWMVRERANKSDAWLNEDQAPIRRIVCAGLIVAGLAMALTELIPHFKGA
jgi:hypothetical protein